MLKCFVSFKISSLFTVGLQLRLPKSTPLLYDHYSRFNATTGCSAPVSCIGTLILKIAVFCIAPLTSRRLVPTVPYKSLNQTRATFTPDTIYSVTEFPADLSWIPIMHPVLMSFLFFTTHLQWFIFIRLSDSHLPNLFRLFLNAHDLCS
jgi:hypothetical protein